MRYIEQKIPNQKGIYSVLKQESNGTKTPTGMFRVRKRIKVNNKWTTKVETFSSYEQAKLYSRSPTAAVVASDLFEHVLESFFKHKQQIGQVASGTLHQYRNRAKHLEFFHGLKMAQINSSVIDKWIEMLSSDEYRALQKSSRQNYSFEYTLLNNILSFYREFQSEHFVIPLLKRHRLNTSSGKREEEIRYLSEEEISQFLGLLEERPVFRDLALFQLETGTRVGEAAALDFRSVSFTHREVRIENHLYWERFRDGKTVLKPGTKAGPMRIIPLSPACFEMLQARRKTASNSKVFSDEHGDWVKYRAIQAVYDRAFKRMGITQRGSHTLRHSFSVLFLNRTKDIYALQRILGHTKLEMTQVYAKYSLHSVREAFKVFTGEQKATENSGFVPRLVPNF